MLEALPTLPKQGSVLVAGLGNRRVTPDAIGPRATDFLLVTRHLVQTMPQDFSALRPVSALAAGVTGTTGIESGELIGAVVKKLKPACLIAVDALAARRQERVCRTVQVSDTGIVPGSGVGSHRTAVDRETVGVPVIAVGVPTVIDGAALGSDTEAAPQGLYVTPRDIDRQVRQLGRLLGYGISLAVQPGLTAEDLAALAE